MYSPRIKPEQLKKIRYISKMAKVPMTVVVRRALSYYFENDPLVSRAFTLRDEVGEEEIREKIKKVDKN